MAVAAKSAGSVARPVRKQRLRLWLRLLTARQVIEAELRKRLRERFDMTLPQFDVMAALAAAPEGIAMTVLSEALIVSNGNITGIIDRLQAKRYVARETAADDRRRFIVRLTPEGLALFNDVAGIHSGWIDELLSEIPDGEVENVLTKLEGLKRPG